jgi:hypothetical protein
VTTTVAVINRIGAPGRDNCLGGGGKTKGDGCELPMPRKKR